MDDSEKAREALRRIEAGVGNIRANLDQLLNAPAMEQLQKDLEGVAEHTQSLRSAVEDGKPLKFWKKIKDPSSVLLSVLALIVSWVSLQRTFTPTPDVRLMAGRDVTVSYRDATLMLQFKAVIANYGRRMDVIDQWQGTLSSNKEPAGQPIYFDSDQLTLSMLTAALKHPFSVKDNSAIEASVIAARRLEKSELAKDAFTSFFDAPEPGYTKKYLLSMEFKTVDEGPRFLDLCFEFTKETLESLQKGESVPVPTITCARLISQGQHGQEGTSP